MAYTGFTNVGRSKGQQVTDQASKKEGEDDHNGENEITAARPQRLTTALHVREAAMRRHGANIQAQVLRSRVQAGTTMKDRMKKAVSDQQ